MAKFISDIHSFITFLTGKGQTGYHSPEEIDEAVHESSLNIFNQLVDQFEKTNAISDDLSPFMIGPFAITLNGSGQVTKPADYKHWIALTEGTAGYPIDVVDHGMLAGRRNDPLCPPATGYAICAFYNTLIQFYPTTISNVKITYFKTPVKPEWAYTIVSDRFVYNDTDSVDIEWKENRHPELRAKSLEYLGINLREADLVQFSQMKKQEV